MRPATRTAVACALAVIVSAVLASCAPASRQEGAPGPVTHAEGAPSWCGTRPIELGLLDGYGGNSWRLVTTASGKEEAAKWQRVIAQTGVRVD